MSLLQTPERPSENVYFQTLNSGVAAKSKAVENEFRRDAMPTSASYTAPPAISNSARVVDPRGGRRAEQQRRGEALAGQSSSVGRRDSQVAGQSRQDRIRFDRGVAAQGDGPAVPPAHHRGVLDVRAVCASRPLHTTWPARMIAAPFSPIMIEGAWVLPLIRVGMIEASMTRRPSRPRTRSWVSTTAISSVPILQEPAGW